MMENRKHETHDMRETSLQAWLELPALGKMQQMVYDCILEHSRAGFYLTDRELAKELGFSDPNNVRPRRYELMKMGVIVEAGKRPCSISHKLALTWRAVEKNVK